MTPETFVEKLKAALGASLKSVVLYGSAVAGDHTGKRSDYNLLVVTEQLGMRELNALTGPARAWDKAGNPPPLLFTIERLKKSSDVFPIELLDIKECHKILFGKEPLEEIDINAENLRLEIEHELKGKLIQLRERYLLTDGKPKAVMELMIQSLSTFLVLFRAALRLYQDDIPQKKLDALSALKEHIKFDKEVFITVQTIKKGTVKIKSIDTSALFKEYLKTVESVVDAVDSHIRQNDTQGSVKNCMKE